MRIDAYNFGQIHIDGEFFTKDVLVLPPRVLSPWWRQEGHRLDISDLDEVLAHAPCTLVIGTGANGAMKVPAETLDALELAQIAVEVLRSGEAARRFNELADGGQRVAAAIHLTC